MGGVNSTAVEYLGNDDRAFRHCSVCCWCDAGFNVFEEKDIRLAPNESLHLAGYDFLFHGVTPTKGGNYDANQGYFTVTQNQKIVAELYPQKRIYQASGMPMTEAGIDASITRDLFVALGEPLGNDGAWALRIYYKPFVRWIWMGGLFMALGGLLAVMDKRYRRDNKAEAF